MGSDYLGDKIEFDVSSEKGRRLELVIPTLIPDKVPLLQTWNSILSLRSGVGPLNIFVACYRLSRKLYTV